MKTLLELRKQMEIDFLKTKTYEEINDMFNQLKEKLDIAESELKKLRVTDVSICTCGTEEYSENEPRSNGMTYCGKCDRPY